MTVQCELCPKRCLIEPGQSGECRIRVNLDGELTAVTYGHPCSVNVDPIEKKPLFHFLPGTPILSLATVGCNLHCMNCQNWEISQANPEDQPAYTLFPEEVPKVASKNSCQSVAYTYSDPVVFYEYTSDIAVKARHAGLKNVLVTAGYLNDKPWRELCRWMDAANIDLKAFSESFYIDICKATLKPVLNALVTAKSMGVWVEVTNLLIPTLNDSDDQIRNLSRWLVQNMGKDTPLHFSRFFPHYRMKNLPPTPAATLDRAREIAMAEGLYYVYIGNILSPDGENTHCPGCGRTLVRRRRYTILENRVRDGRCAGCGRETEGVWS